MCVQTVRTWCLDHCWKQSHFWHTALIQIQDVCAVVSNTLLSAGKQSTWCKWSSIALLKPYCDTDQNTYRAHNRNKYHHCVQRSLSNRLIAAGFAFWFMSSRMREGMLCHQRDTTRSWARCAKSPCLFYFALFCFFDCRVQFLKHLNLLWYTPRLHLNLKTTSSLFGFAQGGAGLL